AHQAKHRAWRLPWVVAALPPAAWRGWLVPAAVWESSAHGRLPANQLGTAVSVRIIRGYANPLPATHHRLTEWRQLDLAWAGSMARKGLVPVWARLAKVSLEAQPDGWARLG